MKINIKPISLLFALFIFSGIATKAQEVENEMQTRTSLKMSFKPAKKLKLSVTPELRFDDSFILDKSLIEGELEYKPLKFLSLGAAYRFVANQRENKDTEYLHRFAYSATAKKDFSHFETSFRLRYSNYADEDSGEGTEFMRYKIACKYDIPKCKITPFVSAEMFQDLDASALHKMRYAAGANYKLFKKNSIGVSYKLDYYSKEYRNKHIISLGYKIKF
ncbi:DUF2490 domain-containing protein [Labilibacter marinus]|uniref:DUF2490 domain-containing protein n=1 Tax=Labilibacter marinus TaxID=1477105 RepID=UPI00094FBDE0|nr:DUF2490 domain-containing protein [Labilibacter marinus]